MTSRDELIRRYADASATPLPPAGLPTHTCGCGATYLDTDGGLDAHEIVFGHRPRAPDRKDNDQDPDRDDERE